MALGAVRRGISDRRVAAHFNSLASGPKWRFVRHGGGIQQQLLITTVLSQQGQGQECFIMVGVEIDRLPEAVFRPLAVAAGLADHSHQTIGRCGETRS